MTRTTNTAISVLPVASEPWPPEISHLSIMELVEVAELGGYHGPEWDLLEERLALNAISTLDGLIRCGSLLPRLGQRGLGLRDHPLIRRDPNPNDIATAAVTEALPHLRLRVLPPWNQLLRERPPLERVFTRFALPFAINPYREAWRRWVNPAERAKFDSDEAMGAVLSHDLTPDDEAVLNVSMVQALALLTPDDGFAIRAKAGGWPSVEIARKLRCTPNAVDIRVHRARMLLRAAGFADPW